MAKNPKMTKLQRRMAKEIDTAIEEVIKQGRKEVLEAERIFNSKRRPGQKFTPAKLIAWLVKHGATELGATMLVKHAQHAA